MRSEQEVRSAAVMAALATLGTPYYWGGNDPAKDPGLDCSGAVLHWWRQAGIDLKDQSAAQLCLSLEETLSPECGDLAFYGAEDKPSHVVMVISDGGRAIIGANRGGKPRQNEPMVEYQRRMGRAVAAVNIEDWRSGGTRYRLDLVGYRKMPTEKVSK